MVCAMPKITPRDTRAASAQVSDRAARDRGPARVRRGVVTPGRAAIAGLLTAVVGIATIPAAAAAPAQPAKASAPAPAAKGVDKGPGPQGPAAAPYPKQQSLLEKAAAVRQDGPKVGTEDAKPVEVIEARTRASRTLQDPLTGEMQTEVSATSLHYRDAEGGWQPIDTRLKAAAKTSSGAPGGWVNGDNRFDATFPASLAEGPVTIADAGDASRSVSLQLLPPAGSASPAASAAATASASATPAGSASASRTTADAATAAPATPAATTASPTSAASAGRNLAAVTSTSSTDAPATAEIAKTPGAAKGAEVTYPDAAGPGLDVAYEAGTDEVKETITLDTAAAAAALAATGGTVSFALSVGKGLTPKLTDTTPKAPGGEQISVVDAKGATAFVIPPAFVDDAKGAHSDAVTYTLTGDATAGWTLTLAPDATWLAASDRAYPVVIDPTIAYPSPITSCSIRSAAATTASCNAAALPLSYNNAGHERALLRFDDLLNVVPADALLQQATINVHAISDSAAAPTSVEVREVTNSFTTSATWNTRDGSTAWAVPGGDQASLISAKVTLNPNGTYQALPVGELVSRWVEGSSHANGFILQPANSTGSSSAPALRLSSANSANSPSLYVNWYPHTGARKADSAAFTQDITDTTQLIVNPATGNATITTAEYAIDGVAGQDLALSHTYNSRLTNRFGPLGWAWTTSAGGADGVRLEIYGYGVEYYDATGGNWVYYKAVDGTYTRPEGLDADLTPPAGGASGPWTLTDRFTKQVQTFTPIGATGAGDASGTVPGGTVAGLATDVDRNGNTITYTYDSSTTHPWSGTKILRSITDTRGRVLNVVNPGYWNTTATDAANRTVEYTVTNEQLVTFTDTAGGKTQFTYDGNRRITKITSPEGRQTLLTYDGEGRVTKVVRVRDNSNGSGPAWTFTYNPYSRGATGAATTTTTGTDADGNQTTYTSDGRGRVARVTDALGHTTTTEFTANDDVAATTAATATSTGAPARTVSTYNPGTWTMASTRMPTGVGSSYTYGSGARLYDVTSAKDARGNQANYTYDAAGNPLTVTRGGTTATTLYQGSTDPQYGGTVNCGPTVNGTVTAARAGLLCESRDGAYVAGSSAAATTAHRTLYRYDANGNLLTEIPPTPSPLGSTSYTYDALSRLTSVTDGKGQVTHFGYDKLDRRTYTKFPNDTSESSHIDGDGVKRSTAEYAGYDNTFAQTRYTATHHDELNRLVQVQTPEGDTALTYTPQGLLSVYTDSAGTTRYGYNAASDLISLAEPGGSCAGQTFNNPGAASTKCILFALDDDGTRTAIRYPGGQKVTISEDDTGRPTRIEGKSSTDNGSTFTTRLDLSLVYADASLASTSTNPGKDTGQITSITDAVAGRKTAYSYDVQDRLTVADATPISGGGTVDYEAFCYDAVGNRTKYYTLPGATCSSANPAISATYNAANQMTEATGLGPTGNLTGTGFSYDGNGNQTAAKSIPGRSTTYNDRDQATSTTPSGGSAIAATYAGGGNLDRLTSGAESFQSSVLSPAPARSTTGTTTTWTIRDPQGELMAIRQGPNSDAASATSYYPFVDQVDSVRALVTAGGTVAASYTYSAFGILRAKSGNLTQPYQYGAGYTDAATGLIKFGIRFYDPTHGRFTQADPTGQEAHDYLYAAGDPIMLNDPQGDIPPLVWAAVVVGIRLAPVVARLAPKVARAAKAAWTKVKYVANHNNFVRIGPTHAGPNAAFRVSTGATRKHWEQMPAWRRPLQPIHIHLERGKGFITNHYSPNRAGYQLYPRGK